MKELQKQGDKLILYTMRSEKYLDEAVEFCKKRGIEFWGVNHNPEQSVWTSSPKVYAHFYIDDAMLGAPLIKEWGKRPYIDWKVIKSLIGSDTTQVLILPED